MTGAQHTARDEGRGTSLTATSLFAGVFLLGDSCGPDGHQAIRNIGWSGNHARGAEAQAEHGANQRKLEMERCHSKGKNSQEGFVCCSDSRSVQNVFPFLFWRNADFTCLSIHFLIHFPIPGFGPQGSRWIINKVFLNAHYKQGTVPAVGGPRRYPFPEL